MSNLRFPWETDEPPAAVSVPRAAPPPKRRGRPPRANPTGPDRPGFLYHHLTVTGPAETIAAFAAAARGSGITPWAHDGRSIEDDVFHLAAAQPEPLRRLSLDGCRVLARQFRERFEAHHARAAARVGHSLACPFDLHALLPVPEPILRLGVADPTAAIWLAEHWGVDALRHVTERPRAGPGRRLPRGHAAIGYGFFTGGGTPDVAVARLTGHWAGLRFELRPRPD